MGTMTTAGGAVVRSRTGLLRLGSAAVLLAALVGCQPRPPAPGPAGDAFAFQTDDEVVLVRGTRVAARLPAGPRSGHGVQLTKDGRFLYAVNDTAVTVVDTRSARSRTIPCAPVCQAVRLPLGASLLGGLDAGTDDRMTDSATVRALDVAAAEPKPAPIGRVRLGSPHPGDSAVLPYSYFLDAAPGEYLFLDFAAGAVTYPRPWTRPQRLYLARLDGTTRDLGRYPGVRAESDVWGAISPDGSRAAVPAEPELTGAAHCEDAAIDLIDTASGRSTRLRPSEPAEGAQNFRVTRAWWGADGTLYANYQQWPCADGRGQRSVQSAPGVWAYRDGGWSKVDTHGPAGYALPLAAGRVAVIEPGPPIADGLATVYDLTHGTLVVLDRAGNRTRIADGVTALAPVPEGD